MSTRPNIVLLATGGTIAGTIDPDGRSYTAGVLSPDALLAQAPGVATFANLQCESCLALDSKDMDAADWMHIAHTTRELLARASVDGVVIAHGTDTLEETAQFLELTFDSDKPVVLTGAMRPADAISADGPANLYDAIRVAADAESRGRGVLVCMNEAIFAGGTVRKNHAHRVDAFTSRNGSLGHARPAVRFHTPGSRPRSYMNLPPQANVLPVVETLHVGAGSSPALAEAAVRHGRARGLVLALPGNGSVPKSWESTISRLIEDGITIVRASRCAESFIGPTTIDERLHTWPAGRLSAAQARVTLILALATGNADADRFLSAAGLTSDSGLVQSW